MIKFKIQNRFSHNYFWWSETTVIKFEHKQDMQQAIAFEM